MEAKFSELEKGAWGGLLATHSKMMALIEEDLQERCGITHVEFEILLRLTFAENNQLRIQELAERSILSRSGTSRLVDRLVKAGLVDRTKAKDDKRGANATLTQAGIQKFKLARNGHIDLVGREFLSKYTDQELEVLSDLFGR